MGFLAWARKIQHRLHQCAESIHRNEERKRNKQLPPDKPIEVRAVVSFDDKTVADSTAEKNRVHTIQESVKKATWYTFFAVTVYALITLGMWCQMIRQNRIAGSALIISQRPWVAIDTPAIRRVNDHWAIDFKIKNFGSSPGLNIATATAVAWAPVEWGPVKWLIDEACARGDRLTTSGLQSEEHGYTVFPGSIPSPQLQTIGEDSGTVVSWVGCVTYLDQFTKPQWGPVHHTRFCYYARSPLTEGQPFMPCFGGQEAD